jgi:hypothetical protein
MHDGVEPTPGIVVGENNRSHPITVERTITSENRITELLDDLLQPRRTRSDNVSGDGVRVDDNCAELSQPTGDLALTGADAAGEPYDEQ